MKTFITEALLLLLLALWALSRQQEGTHFLSFYQALFTWPGLPTPQFISVGFVDNIQFERFNNREDVQQMEHCAPWIDKKNSEDWKANTDNIRGHFLEFTGLLQRMLKIYNYSATGYHTIQRRYGCYVLLHGDFSHGFFELVVNDHDYIMLNEDLMSWTAVGKFAGMLRRQWDSSGFTQVVQSHILGICVDLLLKEVEYGKAFLLRKDTPKIHVTRKVRPDKKITLRCWAFNFYPAEITLTWVTDGINQTSDMEVSETRPSGDGTFQKWAAVVVHSGEEHRYKCHVNHDGLPESATLRWEPPELTVPFLPIVIAGILGALLLGAVMTFLVWKWRTRG